MKYIKQFEKGGRTYTLRGYPDENDEVIDISQREYDLINITTHLIIQWKLQLGSWTYRNEEKQELKDWLECYRMTGDPDLANYVKKYNI